jgi:hypothetical protein
VKDTNPNNVSICVLLARGDHAAGLLLDRINFWSDKGKAKIPGTEGHWCANDRPWWMREAQLSLRQYNLAAAKLVKLGLIEKRQYPFAGRNVLHVRPSTLTNDILASAKTWDMALEVLALAGVSTPAWLAEPGTQVAPSLQEMINAWGKESLAPPEIGKLAQFRQEMKCVSTAYEKYDCSNIALPLIEWVVNNWTNFLTGCKAADIYHNTKGDPSEPSVAFFCEHALVALDLASQEHKEFESKAPSQPHAHLYEDSFEDELEPV